MIEQTQKFDNLSETDRAAKIANEQNIEEVGLVFNEELRLLTDPETGEIIRIFEVTDAETAKAAMYRLYATNAVLEAVAKQKKGLEARQKAIKKRAEWLKSLWREGLTAFGNREVGKAKSINLTYGTVGFSTSTKPKIVAREGAAEFLFKHGDGTALTIGINMDLLSVDDCAKVLALLREVSTSHDKDNILPAFELEVNKSCVWMKHYELAKKHKSPTITEIPAGTTAWYVRENKSGKDQGEE